MSCLDYFSAWPPSWKLFWFISNLNGKQNHKRKRQRISVVVVCFESSVNEGLDSVSIAPRCTRASGSCSGSLAGKVLLVVMGRGRVVPASAVGNKYPDYQEMRFLPGAGYLHLSCPCLSVLREGVLRLKLLQILKKESEHFLAYDVESRASISQLSALTKML